MLMKCAKITLCVATVATLSIITVPSFAAPVDFTAAGANPAGIQGTVDAFRNVLGALNAFDGNNNADGRREINWDAAPDAISDPNAFPGDFFNTNFAPRARGTSLSTPGSELRLSSTAARGQPVRFGQANNFQTFSPERLFSAFDSNIIDVVFRNPAQPGQQALVDGFGVVFTDVEIAGLTTLDFFDLGGALIHTVAAPTSDNAGLSFAGATFDNFEVARVRITTGSVGVNHCATEASGGDCVAIDDFIIGEPQPVPVPAPLAMLAGSLGLNANRRRNR